MAFGQFQQDIHLWVVNQDPKDSKDPPVYAPWIQVLLKSGKMGPQRLNSSPNGRAPYLVMLSTPTTAKVPGHNSWIYY